MTVSARKVLNFVYRMVHSLEAEDLTQETFVAVYQKLGTLQDSDKFGGLAVPHCAQLYISKISETGSGRCFD